MESVQLAYHRLEGERLTCAFYRDISITKNMSGRPITWDLSRENFNLLYSEGDLRNGKMMKHSFAKHTNRQFYFLSTNGYKSLNGKSWSQKKITKISSYNKQLDLLI